MADATRDIFEERDRQANLRAQGLTYMLKGAGWAAAGFAALLIFMMLLVALGRALPPESKEAPDPSLGTTSLITMSA